MPKLAWHGKGMTDNASVLAMLTFSAFAVGQHHADSRNAQEFTLLHRQASYGTTVA
jgi:hypothetical protein